MLLSGCVSCDTLAGRVVPPGGIVGEDDHWVVLLRANPLLVPGEGFIVLKRHCEDLSELRLEEAAALGLMMKRVTAMLHACAGAEKVHIALYAEEVKHVHLHVLPRTSSLPAGNIPLTILRVWRGVLHRAGLYTPCGDTEVALLAAQLRGEFQRSTAS